MTKPEKNGHTFILHLWREKADGLSIWRGSIMDIQNGEKKYFQSLHGLAELIDRFLEDTPMAGQGDPNANLYKDQT
ncbi:MAG: hypothetical protein JNK32_09135 [Anaerolineales bacterium]|nr:hypothetical protein [Anaerolineales bacterium]